MSFSKSKNALARFEYRGFEGIDRRSPVEGGKKASDIVNYRILSDGSLQKRNGYRFLCRFTEQVRAIFSGEINGVFTAYVLAGSRLYSVDMITAETSLAGEIGTSEGRASIFFYKGSLYLADGDELYSIGAEGISVVSGYVPLLGENWGSSYPGKIKEPLNLLNPRARISYTVTDDASVFLSTLYKVSSVEAVYLNDVLLSSSDYVVDSVRNTINIGGLSVGDRVLAYLTFERSSEERAALTRNTEAAVFGGISDSRVFMWGGEHKSRIFCTGFVTEEQIRASDNAYADSGALYFPLGNDFTAGDGRYAVSAVGRHLDRLLIFTEGDTWMADSNACGTEAVPVMRINTENGCKTPYGVAKYGNSPINVGREHIMRWTSNTDELEDANSYSISDGIEDMLPNGFFENSAVFEDKRRGEILFSSGVKGDDRVFVYGNGGKSWYVYDRIGAEKFFSYRDGVGFLRDNALYLFDGDIYEDIGEDGKAREIEAYYEGHIVDFGEPFSPKRIMGAELRADTQADISLSLISDKGHADSAVFSGGFGVSSKSLRFNCGRFAGVRLKIYSSSSLPQRIYVVAITAKR